MNLKFLDFDPTPINGLWIYSKKFDKNQMEREINELGWLFASNVHESDGKRGVGSGRIVELTSTWHSDIHVARWMILACEGISTQFCQSISNSHDSPNIRNTEGKINLTEIYQPPPYSIMLLDNSKVGGKAQFFHRTPPDCKLRHMYRRSFDFIGDNL